MKQSFFKWSVFVLINIIITINCKAQESNQALLQMMPDIPEDITEPVKRAEYLTLHFWDKFDFHDSLSMMKDNFLERCFVDYVDLLSIVPGETMEKSINILMKKSEEEKSIFSLLLKLSEQYLYEQDSPVFDELKLIPFMKYAIQSPLLEDIDKIRPKFLLDNISKNMPGTIANDFTYALTNGETGNLHFIDAEYALLYFNDPECEDCAMLIKQLIASHVINDMIKHGKLKIITVYVNDDIETWEKHESEVPDSWIYSRDAEQKIIIEGIYNIKQFPTIYLLGKEKVILLKETTFEKLEDYFKSI
jgi:hypothetical protein